MKKIFAIALALVMVLSMASAFASACTTGPFNWDCATEATNCGKAKVEVVPYVKTNAACDGSNFVVSDCAAAINGENIYYALKLTVDADYDREWWKQGHIYLSVAGTTADIPKAEVHDVVPFNADDSEDGWVYYYVIGKGWSTEVTEDDDFDIADVMNKSVVKEYAKAKVCFYFESEYAPGTVRVGNYTVKYNAEVGMLWVANKDNTVDLVTYTLDGDGKVTAITYNKTCGEAEYATIKAFMGLEIGTCVTKDAIKKNFGWKDEVKSCYSWKTQNATAIVDTNCVVSIPKTGDVSVVAYAVMAVVAAAGAMLKK
ncbi:MAG: hypothetical protein PUC76_00070 [Clostridia bacterium]|nr:hypothetical protein [Clostridia bacterium]